MYFTNYYIIYYKYVLYWIHSTEMLGHRELESAVSQNKLFLEKHDFENYYVGPKALYRPIPKIPEYDYPELEALYFIFFYEYEDVKYIVIRRR